MILLIIFYKLIINYLLFEWKLNYMKSHSEWNASGKWGRDEELMAQRRVSYYFLQDINNDCVLQMFD